MDFVHFLSTHLLDPAVGGKRLYADTLAQAVHAEACGYRGVAIPEHHLVNILLIPSPLQMAAAIAARTERVALMTSICQLPIRDMRVFAGEVVQAQALCGGRLMLGVGKGAFGFETGRIGVPMEETKERFEEALAVLEALLTREEVSWKGKWYDFDALTVMPRPEDPIPLMLGVMAPPGIEAAAAKGYHVQTTPLSATHGVLEGQVAAFYRGRAKLAAPTNRLSLQRGVFLVVRGAAPAHGRDGASLLPKLRQRLWRPRHRGRGRNPPPAPGADRRGTGPEHPDLPEGRDDRPAGRLCRDGD